MSSVGKQDNIFEDGNLSGLPFTFNQEVTEVFEDMILRSVSWLSDQPKINKLNTQKIIINLKQIVTI